MEVVREGRVFIFWGIYTNNFFASSKEHGQRTSSEEGEKRFGCGTILSEGLQTEKESQPAPSHASRCPFWGKKHCFTVVFHSHAHHWSTSSDFLASHSQGHHPPFPNKSNFPGYSDDEKCNFRMEGCKGTMWGARVPPEYERVTVGCPSFWETLSGLRKILFFQGILIITLGLNNSHSIAARKTYPNPILPSCVEFAYSARSKSKSINVNWFHSGSYFFIQLFGRV
jgi:hypothetical protein